MRCDKDEGWRDESDDGPVRVLILAEIDAYAALRRLVGREGADLAINAVAERISAALPDASVSAVGRNLVECALIAGDRACADDAVRLIHAALASPVTIGGIGHAITLRLGVAASGNGRLGAVRLTELAERALEQARLGLPAQEGATSPRDAGEARLTEELRSAIVRNELFLEYQPKLHIRHQAITSVEALVRWAHPRHGLVPPGEFIPGAERSGVIHDLTLWTLRQVIADQRLLALHGHDLPVFVNIAGVLLSDRGFVDAVLDLLRVSGARLGFEITETSVIHEPERAVAHLQELSEVGVAVAIDDYGAGLSSLAYLKQLPARELKIDKLFITKLSSSHRDPLIVRSTIDLAHALEMEVVAEGVETPTSLALLSVMGCDIVQGFLISRPLPIQHLLTFLKEDRHRKLLEQARSPAERFMTVRAK